MFTSKQQSMEKYIQDTSAYDDIWFEKLKTSESCKIKIDVGEIYYCQGISLFKYLSQ